MKVDENVSALGYIVSFRATDGTLLSGFVTKPKRGNGHAVIFVHGLDGNFHYGPLVKQLSKSLTSKGFTFFSINTRGSNTVMRLKQNVGRKTTTFYAGSSLEKFEDCNKDIAGAIRFIGRNGTKRVFLCGHSTGSQKVTFYQEKTADRRVKGLILLSPADDLNAWKKELGRKFNDTIALARKLYHKDKMAFVPIKILGELRGAQRFFNLADERYAEGRIFNYARPKLTEFGKVRVPVLVVWGQKEEYLPSSIKECNQLLTKSSHSRNLQIKVMRGAGHSFKRHEKELAGIVNGWLTKL